jgi:fructose-1,6-bisphosphatase/inositol monophosphatase family enzyme
MDDMGLRTTQIMEQEFLKRMQDMALQSGEIALRLIKDSSPTLKRDHSVLTKADTAISAFIREHLNDLLATGDHLLIDEEDAQSIRYFNQDTLEAVPYLWAVDPIDGTRNFSNRIPAFGISIGLLKDLKPWLGMVYLPLLGELFYCDGKQSYFVERAFSDGETKTKIAPVVHQITQKSVFFGSDGLFKDFDWDFSFCQVTMPSCAVADLCWPAVGRGCGCFFDAHIWDFAGAWPMFLSAGLNLRAFSTGRELDRIHVDLFQGQGSKTWRLRDHYILSSEANYPLIKSRITPHDK